MRRLYPVLVASCIAMIPAQGVMAQDETLADIRQELTVLYVDIQRLKRELSTTGSAGGVSGGDSALERLDLIEAELSRLTALTERLQNRIDNIVVDGTNRIGDLEFRLVELEGGDLAALGETTTLGGIAEADTTGSAVVPESNGGDGGQFAVAEQTDFDLARAAFDNGSYQEAAIKFTVFTETYPVGPLTGQAHFLRGEALTALGDTPNAARAYLESFSGSPDNPNAPDALLQLGLSLFDLGQTHEACVALGQVSVRYPGTIAVGDAEEAMASIGCQ